MMTFTYAECRYAECHYAQYRYAECCGALLAKSDIWKQSQEPRVCYSTLLPCSNIRLGRNTLAYLSGDKHSSLFARSTNDEDEKFLTMTYSQSVILTFCAEKNPQFLTQVRTSLRLSYQFLILLSAFWFGTDNGKRTHLGNCYIDFFYLSPSLSNCETEIYEFWENQNATYTFWIYISKSKKIQNLSKVDEIVV